MKLLDRASLRLLDRLRLTVWPRATVARQGGHRSKSRATGFEFTDHRPYTAGDDVRRIDWRAFARHRELTIRLFEEEREANVSVLLDISGSMNRGAPAKVEIAKRIAMAFAYLSARQHDGAQVIPFRHDLARGSMKARARRDLAQLEPFLTNLRTEGTTSFSEAANTWIKRGGRPGLTVVVSDLMATGVWERGFRQLAASGHELLVVRTKAAEDENPALSGEVSLVDSETSREFDTFVSKSVLDAYQAVVQEHIQGLRRVVLGLGGRFTEITDEKPFHNQLHGLVATGESATVAS